MNSQHVFLLNLVSTWYMVGLIWMVQIVHYNLMDRVGTDQFAKYEQDHNRLITPIVGMLMLIEAGCTASLLIFAVPGMPRWAGWLSVILLAGVWLSTLLLQIPYHSRLCEGFDQSAYQGLVLSNWIRTVLWTAKGILLAWFTSKMLTGPVL